MRSDTEPTERDREIAIELLNGEWPYSSDVNRLTNAIALAREEGRQGERKRWQPIDPDEDAAPRDGTWVLLFGDGPGFASCQFVGYYGSRSGYDEEACWRQAGWRAEPTAPTHWMPLPEPPIPTHNTDFPPDFHPSTPEDEES